MSLVFLVIGVRPIPVLAVLYSEAMPEAPAHMCFWLLSRIFKGRNASLEKPVVPRGRRAERSLAPRQHEEGHMCSAQGREVPS